MTFEDIDRVMDVDFWGVVNGTKAFLPYLIASGDGHVVNISSLFGLLAVPGQSAYNAAKFAVRGFTETLRQEMLIAGHPVQVTCVHPGGIKTAIARNARAARARTGARSPTSSTAAGQDAPERAAERSSGMRPRRRSVVGVDARVLDLLVRLLGPRYQRFGVLFSRALGLMPAPARRGRPDDAPAAGRP